jgi:hypothetical protein
MFLNSTVKCNGHPTTGHEGREEEWSYSSTLSLTSALGKRGVVNDTPRPLYSQETDPVPNVQAGLDECGKSRRYRDSIPGRPSRSESLYRLSNPGRKNSAVDFRKISDSLHTDIRVTGHRLYCKLRCIKSLSLSKCATQIRF